jgi:hypothetical protein
VPRDLGDVLHYFLPSDDERRAGRARAPGRDRGLRALGASPRTDRPAALPIVALPVGEGDVLRAALAWNLAVEISREGADSTLLSPASSDPSPIWPEAGRGPVGTEVIHAHAEDLGELSRAALDVAVARAADVSEGVVLVRVPPAWLESGDGDGRALLRWVLFFASPERGELIEAYRLAKLVARAHPEARLGLTIHGARRVAEAERAFRQVADVAARHLGRSIESYGMLVDDLQIYRAIVARRPIGLEHPQSRASRALRDVATILLDDARKAAVA